MVRWRRKQKHTQIFIIGIHCSGGEKSTYIFTVKNAADGISVISTCDYLNVNECSGGALTTACTPPSLALTAASILDFMPPLPTRD